jgi:hypothetical protein
MQPEGEEYKLYSMEQKSKQKNKSNKNPEAKIRTDF